MEAPVLRAQFWCGQANIMKLGIPAMLPPSTAGLQHEKGLAFATNAYEHGEQPALHEVGPKHD